MSQPVSQSSLARTLHSVAHFKVTSNIRHQTYITLNWFCIPYFLTHNNNNRPVGYHNTPCRIDTVSDGLFNGTAY